VFDEKVGVFGLCANEFEFSHAVPNHKSLCAKACQNFFCFPIPF